MDNTRTNTKILHKDLSYIIQGCFLVFFFALFGVSKANATTFSVTPQELTLGQETTAILTIDTESQEINAVDIGLKFSPDDFTIKDISDGNSIINLWVEKPGFSNKKGEIYFSGIVPGGFKGASGHLLKIILLPQKAGEGSFEISYAKVLLNDGQGTSAMLKVSNLKFNVGEVGLPSETQLPVKDTELPEAFSPQISSDKNIFNGKYFLVFTTQDKLSGIAGYFIHESTQKEDAARINTKDWIAAESPYFLQDQSLKSYVYVKAVDKYGNERIETLPPQKPLPWYSIYQNYLIYGIITAMAFLGYLIWRKLCGKKQPLN